MSALSLVLCVTMLVGSTFAWFTDTASTGVNTVQAGNLRVDIQDMDGKTLQGKTLTWQTAENRENILWEPGCTYDLIPFQVVNNASLALRFRIAVTGIEGNPALLSALEFRITHGDTTKNVEGSGLSEFLNTYECILLPTGATPREEKEKVGTSGAITISVHMKESAGNEYQKEVIEGIAITVTAAQYTYESDSFGDRYDDGAHAHSYEVTVTQPTCTEGGYTTYKCHFCDVEEIRDRVDALGHNIVSGVCTRCGYTVYRQEGDYVYFGSYPQSKVTEENLIAALNGLTKDAANDVTYDGEKYREAKGAWYKYEPIRWRICKKNDETGEAYLLADSILYTMSYYHGSEVGISPNYKNKRTVDGKEIYSVNYQYSDVRRWLTGSFFPTAFSADQAQIIALKNNTLDDRKGCGKTGSSCSDYVFLPSYAELKDYLYGGISGSCWWNYSSKSMTSYATANNGSGGGYWLTRSCIDVGGGSSTSYNVMSVKNSNGNVYGEYDQTTNTVNGVVPAMWVILK